MLRRFLVLALTLVWLCAACSSATPDTEDGGSVGNAEAKEVASHYARIVLTAYEASIESATAMQTSIDAFITSPTGTTLDAARSSWLAAREDYLPTEPFRFYDGPIDNPANDFEGRINAWPLDEAYIDYVDGNPNAGIVGDAAAFPNITAATILAANLQGGETNISTGWHAIEFLLWGQDRSADGPGARRATDYTTAPNASRRATYLKLVTAQLIDDLSSVRSQWEEGGDYRTAFEGAPASAIAKILRGVGALNTGELMGERIQVAYETRDQEDEHSCFSDNTNRDVVGDLRGLQMVYTGTLSDLTGPSLGSLIAGKDADLDQSIRSGLNGVLKTAESYPAPFESMIAAADGTPERTALLDTLDGLEKLGKDFSTAAKLLGVRVNFNV